MAVALADQPGVSAQLEELVDGYVACAVLLRHFDAVTAGLTLDGSWGSIEGAVNRIKKIKRQLYGRAGFELLRKMILLQ